MRVSLPWKAWQGLGWKGQGRQKGWDCSLSPWCPLEQLCAHSLPCRGSHGHLGQELHKCPVGNILQKGTFHPKQQLWGHCAAFSPFLLPAAVSCARQGWHLQGSHPQSTWKMRGRCSQKLLRQRKAFTKPCQHHPGLQQPGAGGAGSCGEAPLQGAAPKGSPRQGGGWRINLSSSKHSQISWPSTAPGSAPPPSSEQGGTAGKRNV